MKLVVVFLVASVLGALLWFGAMMGSDIRACSGNIPQRLAEGKIRATQTGNIREYCDFSYVMISDWGECVEKNQVLRTPKVIAQVIKPYVRLVLLMTGDRGVGLTETKLEHDLQCQEEPDLMFFPPEQL